MMVLAFLFMLFSFFHITSQNHACENIQPVVTKILENQFTEEDAMTLKTMFRSFPRYNKVSPRPGPRQMPLNDKCLVCRCTFEGLIDGLQKDTTDVGAIASVTRLCSILDYFPPSICQSLAALHVPIIGYIVRKKTEVTAEAFCRLLLQDPSDLSYCYYDDFRLDWEVDLPPVPDRRTQFTPGRKDYYEVALVADPHIDYKYQVSSEANCAESVCCRSDSTPKATSEQTYAKKRRIHSRAYNDVDKDWAGEMSSRNVSGLVSDGLAEGEAGYWGDYNCDMPTWAFEDALRHIENTTVYHEAFETVYYLGGTMGHATWESSPELLVRKTAYIKDTMQTILGQEVSIVPVIGSLDTHPSNQFAPAYIIGENLNTTWMYEMFSEKWAYYLSEETKQTIREGGYYSKDITNGLRVIVLNNNVANRFNWWYVFDPLDAKSHLDWLVKELHEAEKQQIRVHILAHIPPGVPDLAHVWTREYDKIVRRFSNTIAAEFNGHDHTNSFKVFFNDERRAINVAWGASSLVAYPGVNPGYKLVMFEQETFLPTRMLTYAYDLPSSNRLPHNDKWALISNVTKDFNLADLTANTMTILMWYMVNWNEYLDIYAALYTNLNEKHYQNCDINCKLNIVCNTFITVLWQNRRCKMFIRVYYQNTK